jgi:hypothetical protein
MQLRVGFTMRFSEWTLYLSVALCSQHIPGTYGGDAAVKKWNSSGAKLQFPMVRICNIFSYILEISN